MAMTQRISPCLWFADEAEEAARFYTSSMSCSGPKLAGAQRAMEALLKMKKPGMAALRRAHDGT
jgi:predicted 3-demethylubiquinone-9 3-methyltransferase (glyoxalase superfamily)